MYGVRLCVMSREAPSKMEFDCRVDTEHWILIVFMDMKLIDCGSVA